MKKFILTVLATVLSLASAMAGERKTVSQSSDVKKTRPYKTELPDDWKNVKYAKNETLPEARLDKGTAKVRLQVLGYRPEMKYSMLVIGLKAPGSNEQLFLQFPVSDDGTATAEIPVQMAQQANVGLLHIGTTEVILAPGETVECLMDLSAPENKFVAFKGYLAKTNLDVAASRPKLFDDGENEKGLYRSLTACSTPEERVQAMDDWLKGMRKKVNALKITDAAKAMLRMQAEHVFLQWRIAFAWKYLEMEVALGLRKYETDEERTQMYKEIMDGMPVTEYKGGGYYEMLGEPYSPLIHDFWLFINYRREGNSMSLGYDYPGKDGKALKYNDDLRMAHLLLTADDEAIAMENLAKIESEDCKEVVREYYAEQRRIAEEAASDNRFHYQEFDDVKPEDILDTILSRHPGKVVVVDVWATWCGPCRAGHQDMAPLKEELKQSGQPVEFVYLTNPTSPLNTWMAMAGEIPGEHYYLTQAQFKYLMSQYNSNGIPTYAIYDKNKQQRYLTVGYHGSAKMKEEIEKALR